LLRSPGDNVAKIWQVDSAPVPSLTEALAQIARSRCSRQRVVAGPKLKRLARAALHADHVTVAAASGRAAQAPQAGETVFIDPCAMLARRTV
jgi:hypothetical protein